jgi:hypothetical protein
MAPRISPATAPLGVAGDGPSGVAGSLCEVAGADSGAAGVVEFADASGCGCVALGCCLVGLLSCGLQCQFGLVDRCAGGVLALEGVGPALSGVLGGDGVHPYVGVGGGGGVPVGV